MKRKINKRLFSTATLAILVTLLLTVAVCYNLLKKQILEMMFQHFENTASAERKKKFAAYIQEKGAELENLAIFEYFKFRKCETPVIEPVRSRARPFTEGRDLG